MILVTSEPSGATVYLNNEECGKTPVKIKVDKGGVLKAPPVNIVRVEKKGYHTATKSLKKHFRMHFSCIFWFPIVPLINDWDVMVYDEHIHFYLEKIPAKKKKVKQGDRKSEKRDGKSAKNRK